jgi:hypothetical protein
MVCVDKNGNITSIDVEELDQGYYEEDELKSYINDAIAEYNDANGKNSVKLDSFSVEDNVAKLALSYKTAQDYTDFNGIEIYQGKVVESLAAGYTFDVSFAKIENGEVVGAATKQDIYGEDDLKVLIIRANADVQITGDICYVSTQNVKVTGTDTVSIREGYLIDTGSEEDTSFAVSGTVQVGASAWNDATESVTEAATETTEEESTEQIEAETEDAVETTEQEVALGAFETDVYTYIIYR